MKGVDYYVLPKYITTWSIWPITGGVRKCNVVIPTNRQASLAEIQQIFAKYFGSKIKKAYHFADKNNPMWKTRLDK